MTVHIIRNSQVLEMRKEADGLRRIREGPQEGDGRWPKGISQRSMLIRAPEAAVSGEEKKALREAGMRGMARTRGGLIVSAAIAAALACAGCDSAVDDIQDGDTPDVQEEVDVDAGPDSEVEENSDAGEVRDESSETPEVEADSDVEEAEGEALDGDVEGDGEAEADVPGCTEDIRNERGTPTDGPELLCDLGQQTTVTERVIENIGPECETPGEVSRVMSRWEVEIGPGESLDPGNPGCARGKDTGTPEGVRTIVTLSPDQLDTAIALLKSGVLYMGDTFTGTDEPHIFIEEVRADHVYVNEYSAGAPVYFEVPYSGYTDVPRFANRALVAIRESSFSVRLVLIDPRTLVHDAAGETRAMLGNDYAWNPRTDAGGRILGWAWNIFEL